MENNYHNLQYSDDEKVMAYVKAIIKAVNMTHEVTAKSEMKSKKARGAIQSKDKEYMWSVLQEYIHNYMEFLKQSNGIYVCQVDTQFYSKVTAAEIEHQLNIMIGIVYDYEAKHCLAKETIKKCLEKILKSSNVFTKKEIEYLLK